MLFYPLFIVLTALPLSFVFGLPWWVVASHVLVTIISFVLGLVVGWKIGTEDNLITKARLRKTIALMITCIWSLSILADIFVPGYTTSVMLYGIMGAVAGYLFSDEGFSINVGQIK